MDSVAVTIAHAQAIGYVWGRQDAGEDPGDTGYSLAFGKAVALVASLFESEAIYTKRPLQDTFPLWRDTRMIPVRRGGDQYGQGWAVYSPDDFADAVLVPIPTTSEHVDR